TRSFAEPALEGARATEGLRMTVAFTVELSPQADEHHELRQCRLAAVTRELNLVVAQTTRLTLRNTRGSWVDGSRVALRTDERDRDNGLRELDELAVAQARGAEELRQSDHAAVRELTRLNRRESKNLVGRRRLRLRVRRLPARLGQAPLEQQCVLFRRDAQILDRRVDADRIAAEERLEPHRWICRIEGEFGDALAEGP